MENVMCDAGEQANKQTRNSWSASGRRTVRFAVTLLYLKEINYTVFDNVLSQEALKIITIASTPISFIKLMLDICLLWKGKCCFVFLG